jgi:hypothetical protein
MRDATPALLSRIEALEARLRTIEATQSLEAESATPTPPEHTAAEPSSRRDLLRYGAVALGAAAAAGLTTSPVKAANGDPLIIGSTSNTGSSSTGLTSTTTGAGLFVTANGGDWGVLGQSARIGVQGQTSSTDAAAAGVFGWSQSVTGQTPGVTGVALAPEAPGVHGGHSNGNGVRGETFSTDDGSGVYGRSRATDAGLVPGVYGHAQSPNAPAVYGRHDTGGNAMRAEIPPFATENAIAMYALNYSSYTGPGPGAGGFAIYGLSARGHGLVGATAATGGAAVVGASNGVLGAYAAAFYGPVIIGGDFTVVGGAKSAAVPHPDGSHRRLYCLESPESWFEDFGRGTLACGEATVALDPDFAAVVDPSDYHVFLTGYDGRANLSVCDRSADGFRVRGGEGAGGEFSWRVVAKRKDIAGGRLERVEVPKQPTLPDVPASASSAVGT